jgi:hypothetical protein
VKENALTAQSRVFNEKLIIIQPFKKPPFDEVEMFKTVFTRYNHSSPFPVETDSVYTLY